jgi:hypothetical protein
MKSLLICPGERPGVPHLAENAPLAVVPLLGRTLIEYWLEALVARGAKSVVVLASDRPHQVRALVSDGSRWGLRLDLLTQSRELTIEEARRKFRPAGEAGWLDDHDVVLLDHLPGQPEIPLFESYAQWFEGLKAFMRLAVTPARIGAREVQPGVWVGLHAHIDPTARLHAPCWVGEHTLIAAGAMIGPGAILDDRVIVEAGARVTQSVIGPETFIGELISVENSLAQGSTLVNWKTGSCLRVPDAFFLSSLNDRRFTPASSSLLARVLAAVSMIITAPVALAMMAWSLVRGEALLVLRLGVRPQHNMRSTAFQTFAYYELAGSSNWLHRWPQFWSIVRGDLAWVGNRPLRPMQALMLENDFERLWLAAPVGIVSLADAHGCKDEFNEETCAHASYYSVNASPRLDWFVLSRAMLRAALAWPISWKRRKDAAVRLPQLAGKQQA